MPYHRFSPILFLMLITLLSACSGSEDGDIASLENIENESLPGATLTRKKCGSCHKLESGFSKIGPSLEGIFGRTPKISGVPYAVWDEKALDEWIENPTKVKPRTRMAVPGNKSAAERAAIIEYLKQI